MATKAANADDVATHEWVRQQLAEQPQRLYESAKAKASENSKGGLSWIFAILTVCLFITGSVYAGLLSTDLEGKQGASNSSTIDWRHDKMGRLIVSGFTTSFGFIALAITIGSLVYTESVILQNQNRIALGIAIFALLMSILIYMIAIRTRVLPA
jgi:ABC-type Fe3+ transport system permease subunit